MLDGMLTSVCFRSFILPNSNYLPGKLAVICLTVRIVYILTVSSCLFAKFVEVVNDRVAIIGLCETCLASDCVMQYSLGYRPQQITQKLASV